MAISTPDGTPMRGMVLILSLGETVDLNAPLEAYFLESIVWRNAATFFLPDAFDTHRDHASLRAETFHLHGPL